MHAREPSQRTDADQAALRTLIASALTPNGCVPTTLCAALPHTLAIYAFGSWVGDTADADSDLDIAVLVAGYVPALQLWDLACELNKQIGCSVDLLDLRAASTVMQYQVLTTGTRVWAQPLQAGLFECFVLSEKLELDAARADLIHDIKKAGRVYG